MRFPLVDYGETYMEAAARFVHRRCLPRLKQDVTNSSSIGHEPEKWGRYSPRHSLSGTGAMVDSIFRMAAAAVVLIFLPIPVRAGALVKGSVGGRRWLGAVSVALVGLAMPADGRAASVQDAQALIQTLAGNAITAVADKQLSDGEREERFRRLFVSSFDIPGISRFVLARYWRSATPAQQQEFLKLFEDINVVTWARRFKEYDGENLETTMAAADDTGWTVDSRIARRQGPPIPVQWRVRQIEDGSLRVVDIVVEDASMAITMRSDYSAAMQANGGQFDSLLATLRTKTAQLKGEQQ
jgi:phospholipid transport system substrate-binding protein